MFAAVGLALMVVGAPANARSPAWEQQWTKAKSMTAALDFEGALPVLKALVAQPDIPPGPRAQILCELGIAYLNVGDPNGASSAFARALTFDANVTLSPLAPPKAVLLFDQERNKLAPAPQAAAPAAPLAPTPPAAASAAPPPAAPTPAPAVSTPPPVAAPPAQKLEAPVGSPEPAIVEAPEAPARRHLTLPALLVAAGTAVAFGAGVAFAFASQGTASELSTTPHAAAVASGLLSQRTAFSAASITAYALGGALAIACLVLLIRGLD
jgi:hypothetical protein